MVAPMELHPCAVAHGARTGARALAPVMALALAAPMACSRRHGDGHDAAPVAPVAPGPPGPAPVLVAPAALAAVPRGFHDAMSEVGRRFERAGRAVVAGRWPLAAYDLQLLTRVFVEDLPRAPRPDDVPIDPTPIAAQFAARALPPLVDAVRARDRAAFEAAFAAAARECNFCHHDAHKVFIEIPTAPGVEVPVLAPVPAPAASP